MRIAGRMFDLGFGTACRVVCSWLVASLAVYSLAGCGTTAGPGTVPVSGTVKLNGEPLEGASVSFLTDEDGRTTKTDKDGHFQFTDGTKPLKYRVVVSKYDGAGGIIFDPELGMDEGQVMAMEMSDPSGKSTAAIAKQLIPEKYSSKTKSELSFTVPLTGTQEANFDLTE